MSNEDDSPLRKLVPNLKSDWELNKLYNDQIERGVEGHALRLHLQLQTVKSADLSYLFNPFASGEKVDLEYGEGLVATAEKHGLDASGLRNGLYPGF